MRMMGEGGFGKKEPGHCPGSQNWLAPNYTGDSSGGPGGRTIGGGGSSPGVGSTGGGTYVTPISLAKNK